jgi:protein-S-isoprenylcysteine O-methyltransferase Ste14
MGGLSRATASGQNKKMQLIYFLMHFFERVPMEQPRKIVPPIYLALSLVAMYLLDRYFPVGHIGGPFVWGFASAFISLGLMCILISAGLFKRAGTPLIPFHKSTALVTDGPYKYTRNPMYLGMVLILVGAAVILGSLLPWMVIPAFALIIQQRFILPEERFLEELFGEEYLDYKEQVRRWV